MSQYLNYKGVFSIVFLLLLKLTILAQRDLKFALIPIGELSYFSIDDCNCSMEPIGGNSKKPFFAPGWGIEALLFRNLSIKVEMNSFKHSSKSSGLINTTNYDILSTSLNHTSNRSIGGSIGFLTASAVKIGPEIGFMAFRRTITGGTVTQYYYENSLDDPHAYSPNAIPDSIQTYGFNHGISWKANAITLGFNAWIPVKFSIYLFANIRIIYLGNQSNWFNNYQHSWLFKNANIGIGFNLLNNVSEIPQAE